MPGFLSRRSREMDLPLEMRRENGAIFALWWDTRYSSRVEMGMLGNFVSCLKGVKDPFEAQEGRWDFSRDSAAAKGLILH